MTAFSPWAPPPDSVPALCVGSGRNPGPKQLKSGNPTERRSYNPLRGPSPVEPKSLFQVFSFTLVSIDQNCLDSRCPSVLT